MTGYEAIRFVDDVLYILDQRKLPSKEEYFEAKTYKDIAYAIDNMVLRGAPLIGIAAAFGIYLSIKDAETKQDMFSRFYEAKGRISQTRPTAVSLFRAMDEMEKCINEFNILPEHKLKNKLRAKAISLWEREREMEERMAETGADYLSDKRRILTHCNTGILATGGYGTALGVIRKLWEKNKDITVIVDETRPFLQGSRLTAWELKKLDIPYRIVVDGACCMLMDRGLVDCVIVGADRIARNGDVANKIGTASLSTVAKRFKVPFFVVAPFETIDKSIASGKDIPIEIRGDSEITRIKDCAVAPQGSKTLNFSFDITNAEFVSAIITEEGIFHYPYNFK
ncbi:MAG: S-methyl-5-thioribose-1-phosphate isomerase [Deltaproteobacteria bacterium]|nr:S-methyl-5-thioribose-1-phosphate isomerase [Deltaproteobacteria bacterium]